MAHLCLVRVDSRMIHGQVMTMWSKFDGVNHILAIDDGIAADPFMQEIYKMAVPHTLKVSMISVKEAAERFQNGTLDDDRYLVLFKECNTPLRAWKEGFSLLSSRTKPEGALSQQPSLKSQVVMASTS